MGFREFPRHLHKAGGAFVVVQDEAGKAAALAAGWFLTPLEAEQAVPAPVGLEAAAEAAAGVPEAAPETLDGLTAKAIAELVAVVDAVPQIVAWREAEAAGKARKGVIALLEARLVALAEP